MSYQINFIKQHKMNKSQQIVKIDDRQNKVKPTRSSFFLPEFAFAVLRLFFSSE